MGKMFRELRPDEIDCRISQIKVVGDKAQWLSLLLYKDARCDQNILDETVGAYGWQKEYTRDNRNCIVKIWDDHKQQWVSKEDTGTESNTEKEKGLASDSFKRACFCWGIGRELYTAPFIMIKPEFFNLKQNKTPRGEVKYACYDNFIVTDIDYNNGNICYLTIKNVSMGKECFRWGKKGTNVVQKDVAPESEPTDVPEEVPAAAQSAPQAPVAAGNKAPAQKTMDKPSSVTTANKLPPEAATATEYIKNEIAFMSQLVEISDQNTMLAQFAKWKETLIKAGVPGVVGKKTKDMSLAEAKALVDAIYKNFLSDKKEEQAS